MSVGAAVLVGVSVGLAPTIASALWLILWPSLREVGDWLYAIARRRP